MPVYTRKIGTIVLKLTIPEEKSSGESLELKVVGEKGSTTFVIPSTASQLAIDLFNQPSEKMMATLTLLKIPVCDAIKKLLENSSDIEKEQKLFDDAISLKYVDRQCALDSLNLLQDRNSAHKESAPLLQLLQLENRVSDEKYHSCFVYSIGLAAFEKFSASQELKIDSSDMHRLSKSAVLAIGAFFINTLGGFSADFPESFSECIANQICYLKEKQLEKDRLYQTSPSTLLNFTTSLRDQVKRFYSKETLQYIFSSKIAQAKRINIKRAYKYDFGILVDALIKLKPEKYRSFFEGYEKKWDAEFCSTLFREIKKYRLDYRYELSSGNFSTLFPFPASFIAKQKYIEMKLGDIVTITNDKDPAILAHKSLLYSYEDKTLLKFNIVELLALKEILEKINAKTFKVDKDDCIHSMDDYVKSINPLLPARIAKNSTMDMEDLIGRLRG